MTQNEVKMKILSLVTAISIDSVIPSCSQQRMKGEECTGQKRGKLVPLNLELFLPSIHLCRKLPR